jgi:hypothetical protein
MKKTVLFAAAVAVLALPSHADAKKATHRHHARQRAVQYQPQIACTAVGCVPVPRGCGQTPGRTWSGMPSGNDIIVCPPGVAPFR